MGIIIHQSLCGENSKKAWDLLQTTMSDVSIARSIAFKTDLQDQAGGVAWQPTIRGFMEEDYFLLIKTYPDKSPDVRTGRAFSHVLLIPKDDIDSITDIGSLFKYLPDEIDKSIPLEPINVNPKEASGISLPKGFQERFNKAIHGYRKSNEHKNTIIWVGGQNFEQAVFRLWQILSSKEKKNVNFGIYFNVVAIPEGKLNFITTPENIESKFINRGFCLIRTNDTHTLTDISEQFLAGHESAGLRITQFQHAIEAEPLSRTDIDKVAIVIKTFEEFDSTTDLKKLNSLASIIGEYSPDEEKGVVFKEKLVEKIKMLIEKGDVTEIPLIKKFNVKSFRGSENKFISASNNWLDKNLLSISASTKGNASILFKQLRETSDKNWWTKSIGEKVKTFLAKINSDSAAVIFNWLHSDFAIFKEIQSNIDNSKKSENYFISQLPPSFDKSNFAALREFAVKREWYKFHSTLLIKEYPFELAITEQLKVDTDSNSLDGIEIIIKGIKQKPIIDFSVSNGDKRLLKIAGKFCFEDSSHLEKIDFKNVHWQEVWLNAITNGNKVTDGFRQPQIIMFKLFDTMVEGNFVDEKLLDKICETEFGNLLNYSRREKLWSKFSSTLQTNFLAKTASALLEALSKDSTIEVPTDRILSDYILKYAIGDFLYYNPIKNALPIFNRFSIFPENYIVTYITNYQDQISAIEATQFGKLIKNRKYRNVASAVFYKSTPCNNWKIALAECYLLLSFWDQANIAWTGIIKNATITADQWWASVEEIIIDLYSNANSLITVWKKAGGDEADLLMNATPRDVWSNAIHNLRIGKFSGIDMCSLLKQIKKNYGENEKFKIIYDLRKNYINC